MPRGASGTKITAGILTAGLSMLVTGAKNGKSGTEMIPIKSVHSIATRRDGMLNSFVSVITTGNTVDFRVSHKEAAVAKETLTRLITGTHESQLPPATPAVATPAVAAPASTAAPDLAAQLQQLAALRDAGVLTEDEFSAKKAQLLERF